MRLPHNADSVFLQSGRIAFHGLAADALWLGTHTDVDCFNAGGHQPFQLLSHAGVFLWRFAAVAATQKSAKVNVLSGQWQIQNAGMPHTPASTMSIRCKREKGNKREQIKSSARRYFFFPQQFLYFLPLPQGQGAFLAGVPAIVAAGAVFALNSAAISPR